jgi:[acyl-carrier-protein] S-malonyltransferase
MRAVIFPGQGSQYVGMGLDFYKKFESVKKNFDIVDKTLGYSLSDIIFKGPEDVLKLTQNTQPAIMLIGVSIFNVLNKDFNLDLNNSKFFAGHSLGEYTALVCAGALSIDRAAYLLNERGKAMQESVPPGEGSMLAILGMSMLEIEKEINSINSKEVCEIANDNCDGQVVVSGKKIAITTLMENLKMKKKRGILLPVSAPFHCSLMEKASSAMKSKIHSTNFSELKPSIISNVTAKEEMDIDRIKPLLIDQITSRVRWKESIEYMIDKGVKDFLEIGPSKVLSGLVKKINKNVKIKNINSIEDIQNV